MINLDLEKQIQSQINETIQTYLNSDALHNQIQTQVEAAVTDIIKAVASKVYADISNDGSIQNNIKRVIQLEANQHIHDQSISLVRQELSRVPIKDIVEQIVNREVKVKFDRLEVPDGSINASAIAWHPNAISGNFINGGCITNFSSTGIDDKANNCELTIMDNHVVVEKNFTASTITAVDKVIAKDLIITGNLEHGENNIQLLNLITLQTNAVMNQRLAPMQAMFKNGEALLTENSLSPSVVNSNLRRVGNLTDLTVMGDAKFSETLLVSSVGRVGINSEDPKGALTIRDDDAEVSFVKSNRRTMFIGSTRDINIELGVNNTNQIVLKADQIDFNAPINVMGLKFSVANSIPEHQGIQNEIVFVSTAREGQPRFYICKGGNKWQSLI